MFADVERKWQHEWAAAKTFEANRDSRPKFFLNAPFPYVNGAPHLGHGYTFTKVDVAARFKRMQGFNVLLPFGFHATGEPIMGVVERLKAGDMKQKQILLDSGVSSSDLENFKDAEFVVKYWMRVWRQQMDALGISADWRRTFVTTRLTPTFSRFVEWQYNTLRKKGYVVQGTHPVIYCPKDRSPTGDHDRLEGEGVSPEEYTLILFPYKEAYLPAATLRPETVFGVTNIWVNPNALYAECKVDGKLWIVARDSLPKLREQKKVEVVKEFEGSEIIGNECFNPVTKKFIPILPATFVDSNNATGIVMSVPAHAPNDWAAIEDLLTDPRWTEKVRELRPISLIVTPGLSEFPGVDAAKTADSQNDKTALEKATSLVYKKEFHQGILTAVTGKYAGAKVSEVKEKLIADFKKERVADIFYDTTEKVVCRCGTTCVVKILENQWFLKFSDEKWKLLAKKALQGMTLHPELLRSQFENTIDWLKDKACARRSGLGTPVPWDKEWIVETLSDSVIYMAYYTLAKTINENKITEQQLTDHTFNYILLGKNKADAVAKKGGIDPKVLEELHEEFKYWYPLDLRSSGKDLVQNHLTFLIFHHTALFPPTLWPRAIAVNGYLTVEGDKMSKSKGNFVTLKQALNAYGADVTRFALAYAAEGIDDPNWSDKEVRSHSGKLAQLLDEIRELKTGGRIDMHLEEWLQSRMHTHIRTVTEAYESLNTRTAIQAGFFDFLNDIKWYRRRGGENQTLLKEAYSVLVRLLAPVVPHVAEEAWSLFGNRGFVATAQWPKFDQKKISEMHETSEELVKQTERDIESIVQLTGKKPTRIQIFVAPDWKGKIHDTVVVYKDRTMKEIVGELMKDNELKTRGGEVIKVVERLLKDRGRILGGTLSAFKEMKVLLESMEFLTRTFDATIEVTNADRSTNPKARAAMPGKPAIFLE